MFINFLFLIIILETFKIFFNFLDMIIINMGRKRIYIKFNFI